MARAEVYDLTLASADYPDWTGPPRRCLVLCTQQRSGSTLLGEALTFARGLGCPLEYFHEGFRPAFQARWQASELDGYVANLWRRRTDPSGVLSIKLFWRDLVALAEEIAPDNVADEDRMRPAATPADFYRGLFAHIAPRLPHAEFLFLHRRDTVRQAISNYAAWRTGGWRRLSARDAPPPPYDFDAILGLHRRILRSNAHWRNFFAANALVPHEIVYEDMEQDYQAAIRRLLDALGRADAPVVPPRLHKQGDDAAIAALTERFLRDFHARGVP
ncbi:MAG: Stf0 family sulfotransferase [Rhizomicrobium sp.]